MTQLKANVGDRLFWDDPEDGVESGWYTVMRLEGSVALIENEDDGAKECEVSDLHVHEPPPFGAAACPICLAVYLDMDDAAECCPEKRRKGS